MGHATVRNVPMSAISLVEDDLRSCSFEITFQQDRRPVGAGMIMDPDDTSGVIEVRQLVCRKDSDVTLVSIHELDDNPGQKRVDIIGENHFWDFVAVIERHGGYWPFDDDPPSQVRT